MERKTMKKAAILFMVIMAMTIFVGIVSVEAIRGGNTTGFEKLTIEEIKAISFVKSKDVGDVVHSIPTPEGGAYDNRTTGLAWDGTYIWCDKWDKIYKLNPSNGSVVSSFPAHGSCPYDLVWDGTYLWQADMCDPGRIYKLNPSNGSVISSFSAANPEGLTWDGNHLWYGTYDQFGTDIIHKVNPSDGEEVASFYAPEFNVYGLAWDGTYLWCAGQGDVIYKLDPSDGSVVSSFSFDTLYSGLTWDGAYLWVACGGTIYQIDVGYIPPCTCGNICVNTSGWWRTIGDFTTSDTPIQHAIENASEGETICVKDGTYTENVDVNVNHLTIKSENGSDSTIVIASNSSDHVFNVTADWVNITGFTARGIIEEYPSRPAGIYLDNANYCNISNNNVSNNYRDGIHLMSSSNNTLTNNIANSNDFFGIGLDDSTNNTIANNTLLSNSWYGIVLWFSSDENTVKNNNISGGSRGICLGYSDKNAIGNNTISGCDLGIEFQQTSESNTLENNIINLETYGVLIGRYSTGYRFNNILNNTISSAQYGIYLDRCDSSTVSSNNVSSNDIGIYLNSSSNDMLTNNTASNNDYGIYLHSSSNNTIYNNYFNNTNNAYDDGNNIWNITKTEGTNIIGGPYLSGNYWSDYAGKDLDGDGLGDTLLPYNSSGNIQNGGDYLPLVKPAAPPGFDTEPSENPYPSIMGTHEGKIEPSCNINVSKLYTYPCVGTGGHTESIKLYENDDLIASGTWNGYQDDHYNITITPSVTLLAGHTYNYTIVTGSYPQIIHEPTKDVTGGTITCTSFVDANGKTYADWIPAIRLE